jgi:hypothetical protein
MLSLFRQLPFFAIDFVNLMISCKLDSLDARPLESEGFLIRI